MHVSTTNQRLAPSEVHFVWRVRDRLIGSCMRSKGFEYEGMPTGQPGPIIYPSPEQLRRVGYGFDFDAHAKELAGASGGAGIPRGVDLVAWDKALGGAANAERIKVRTSDGTIEASASGCVAVGRKQLFGTVPNAVRWEDTALAYAGALSSALKSISAYRGPLRAWQSCMKRAGVDVGRFDSGSRFLLRETTKAELRGTRGLEPGRVEKVAGADASCQESSGLYEARTRLMARAQARADRSRGFEGGELEAFDQALLARAKKL